MALVFSLAIYDTFSMETLYHYFGYKITCSKSKSPSEEISITFPPLDLEELEYYESRNGYSSHVPITVPALTSSPIFNVGLKWYFLLKSIGVVAIPLLMNAPDFSLFLPVVFEYHHKFFNNTWS